jgi:hypothetical protein
MLSFLSQCKLESGAFKEEQLWIFETVMVPEYSLERRTFHNCEVASCAHPLQ